MDWNSSYEDASGRKKKLLKLEDELHQSQDRKKPFKP
jgi:hypothetical protein